MKPPRPPQTSEALLGARPDDDGGLHRAVGLQRLLGAVLGDDRPLPRVGRWVVERRVGQGGMGAVYRASDPDDGRAVAIKTVERGGDVGRFEREARLLRAVDHPGVVRYLDHGVTDEGTPFLVMEWLDGQDLAARIRRGPLDLDAVVSLGITAARGLGAAHRAGVVHRDVKPANLFLRSDGAVVVVDFGIARGGQGEAQLTRTGEVLGTPAYMAPEQLRGLHDVRTDVYGLGAALFEAVTGAPPFRGPDPGAVLSQVLTGPVPSVLEARPDAPPALELLIARMMARDPALRPPDMATVEAELGAVAAVLSRGGRPIVSAREAADRGGPQATWVGTTDGLLGRALPRAMLDGALEMAREDGAAVIVAVEGEAGSGRTALLEGWAPVGWEVRRARVRGGAAFEGVAMLAECDDGPLGQALAAVGGGGDPAAVGDAARLAWLDAVTAWTSRGPVLLVVDDLDRADPGTIRLLDAALQEHPQRVLVVAAAVREGGLPRWEAPAPVVRVSLGPLRDGPLRRLVQGAAPELGDPGVERVVRGAEGNPGRALALARAEVGGGARSRLSALGASGRRVLRAAAIVGEALWPEAVAELLGLAATDPSLRVMFATLVAEGWLEELRVGPGAAPMLRFVDRTAWAAALDACEPDERRAGHAAVAAWMAARGIGDERALAEHHAAAGAPVPAGRLWLRLVRAAMAAGDTRAVAGAMARVERGVDVALDAEADGTAALVALWQGRMAEAAASARAAASRLVPASEAWFEVQSLALTGAGQAGDHAAVEEIAGGLLSATPGDAAAAAARWVGLCRAITQLGPGGRPVAHLAEAIAPVEAAALPPAARAWLWRARGTLAAPAFDPWLTAFLAAHRAHLDAGDPRSAAQVGLYVASHHVWCGAWEDAEEVTTASRRVAERLGAAYLVTWARYVEGKRLAEVAGWKEALDALDAVVAAAAGSPRIQGGAWLWSALAALRHGRAEEALARARQAAAAHGAAAVQAPAWAVGALLGEEVTAPVGLPGDAVEFVELYALGEAAALRRAGREEEAARALTVARERALARAGTLADPVRRNRYLSGPYFVRELLAGAG